MSGFKRTSLTLLPHYFMYSCLSSCTFHNRNNNNADFHIYTMHNQIQVSSKSLYRMVSHVPGKRHHAGQLNQSDMSCLYSFLPKKHKHYYTITILLFVFLFPVQAVSCTERLVVATAGVLWCKCRL